MNSNILRRELEKRNMSVRQLAIKANIIPQALYAAMNGRTEFWSGWKSRVAQALDMKVEDLFPEEGCNDKGRADS